MFDLSLYLTFIASVLFLLLTPGPVIALITSTTARHGRVCALKTAIGTNTASLILILIAILAISGFISINQYFIYVIGTIGSIYIIYSSLIHLINIAKGSSEKIRHTSKYGFRHGFIIAISNPKDIFFFISFFPQFINITNNLTFSLIVLCISWIILDLSILSAYIFLINKLSSNKTSKILDVISTLFLLLIGVVAFIYNVQMIQKIIFV